MIIDSGPLVAIDRGDRVAMATFARAVERGVDLDVSSAVVAQVVRDPVRQHQLGRVLSKIEHHALHESVAIGRLLAATGTSDVVDGHVAVLANGLATHVWTHDRGDLEALGAKVID